MKKHPLARTVQISFAAGAALALVSCDKPAEGLSPLTSSGQKSVYDSIAGSGTATAAPAAEASKAPEAPKASETKPESAVVKSDPPRTEPMPEAPAPAVTTAPAPAPAVAAPAVASAPPAAPSGPSITIKPEMPKPLFAGTPLPQNNPPPNLDKSGKPTLEVQVPEGVALLSKGKPVSCSDGAPLGELTWVTDGDKNGDDGYFVDILPQKQWVQIDLEATKEVHLVWVWHFHKQAVIYKDVVVQVSDDPEFNTGVTTVYNNDFDNSAGFGVGNDQSWVETNNGRPMPVAGVKGRYVRLYSNGRDIDDTNQYIEVEVYGK
jgi:hypothetical protein